MSLPIPMSRLAGLLALGLVLAAGCTSPAADPCTEKKCDPGLTCVVSGGEATCVPPSDPCGSANPCKADEKCVVSVDGRAACLAPDRCRGVTCPSGKACDPGTGQCTVDRKPCDGVTCPNGQTCNESSGHCEDANSKCLLVCCNNTQVCDPTSGTCVDDQCLQASVACKCGPSQVCNGVTGGCDPLSTACGVCAANEYCDTKSGKCLTVTSGTPAAGEIGSACGATPDCSRSGADAFCITDHGLFGDMPGGTCSASCNVTGCPSGAGCVDVGLQICLDICLTKADCRTGYACTQITSDDPKRYCFPEAPTRSTCSGTGCQPIGGACEKDDDCIAGAECAKGLPGGYCQKRNCKPSECDQDSENCWCLTADKCSGATIGLAKCDMTLQNCRPGYTCLPVTSDNKLGYCYARQCESDEACRPGGTSCQNHCDLARGYCDPLCTKDADCVGGRLCDKASGACYQACRTSTANCGPDAFCDVTAQRCVHKCQSDAACGEGNYCDRASGKCFAKCTTDASCGSGQFCDATGTCRTRCSEDTDCAASEYCDESRCKARCQTSSDCTLGEFCDAASGRCGRDLKQTQVGAPCAVDRDCGPYNAQCLTGGYPGGYCVAPDCGATAPCGPTAACVTKDGQSQCMLKCQGDGDCRAGYHCVNKSNVQICEPQ